MQWKHIRYHDVFNSLASSVVGLSSELLRPIHQTLRLSRGTTVTIPWSPIIGTGKNSTNTEHWGIRSTQWMVLTTPTKPWEDNVTQRLKQLSLIEDNFLQINFVIDKNKPFSLVDKKFYTYDVMISSIGGCLESVAWDNRHDGCGIRWVCLLSVFLFARQNAVGMSWRAKQQNFRQRSTKQNFQNGRDTQEEFELK